MANYNNFQADKIYLGNIEVDKVYLGDILLYEKGGEPVSSKFLISDDKTSATLNELPYSMQYGRNTTQLLTTDVSSMVLTGCDLTDTSSTRVGFTFNNITPSYPMYKVRKTIVTPYTTSHTSGVPILTSSWSFLAKSTLEGYGVSEEMINNNQGWFVFDSDGKIDKWLPTYDSKYEFSPSKPSQALTYNPSDNTLTLKAGEYDATTSSLPVTLTEDVVLTLQQQGSGMYYWVSSDGTYSIRITPPSKSMQEIDWTKQRTIYRVTPSSTTSTVKIHYAYGSEYITYSSGWPNSYFYFNDSKFSSINNYNLSSIAIMTGYTSGSNSYYNNSSFSTFTSTYTVKDNYVFPSNYSYTMSSNAYYNLTNKKGTVTFKDDTTLDITTAQTLTAEQMNNIKNITSYGYLAPNAGNQSRLIVPYISLTAKPAAPYSVTVNFYISSGILRIGSGNVPLAYFNFSADGTLESVTQEPLYNPFS